MAQKDTTNDIVKTIGSAAKGGVEIAEHIADVAAGAEQVMNSAQAVEVATIELHSAATELSHRVDRFQTD